MRIGIPRETKPQEMRVGMPPSAVGMLVGRGHQVLVEAGAGLGAGFSDLQYQELGATLVADAAAVFGQAELVVKVKEPQPAELGLLGPQHVLFTFLHLAADPQLTAGLLASGCTALGYETLMVNRRLPLLEPMSEIAGRMAPIVGAYHLARHRGGRGTLLTGVPGVSPARVVVLGGGTAGSHAARVAAGMGAQVTILEIDPERIRLLDQLIPHARTLVSTEANLAEQLGHVDLLIAAVLVPGARAPTLLPRELLRRMPHGSVLVDIAVDQGGCAATTRPTTHDQPTYVEEGVVHYCVANMPGAFARTATQALTNATHPWVELIANHGLAEACKLRPELTSAINVIDGKLVR